MSRFGNRPILLFLLMLMVGCKTGNFTEDTAGHSAQTNLMNNDATSSNSDSISRADSAQSAVNTPNVEKSDSISSSEFPPGATTTFSIDTSNQNHSISPYIYGLNTVKDGRPRGIRFARQGGNRLSAYNWENNASNAGTDWYNQNDNLLGSSNSPGKYTVDFIKNAFSHGGAALVTVPMLGYVAADKSPQGDVNQTPDYLKKRFYISKARKGAPLLMTPVVNDQFVYQDEYVNFLEKMFPDARAKSSTELFYSLDNEPGLWASTHPRLRGDASGDQGQQVTYAELMEKTIDYASTIKSIAPDAKIFGPALYGYTAFVNLQYAPDANGRDFIEFYLQQLAKAEKKKGKRLVDVLDIHWYPEVSVPTIGKIMSADNVNPVLVKERIQAPRSLWDKDYIERSWISQNYLHGPIALLPDLQSKIDKYYPGTRIAITEYYYGGGNDISGAIAQADVLGILGRENVFAANLWKMGDTMQDFVWGAFEMYTSFNAKGDKFGDISIAATNADAENYSIYAALDSTDPGRMTIMLINKAENAVQAGVDIAHGMKFRAADIYQLTASDSKPKKAGVLDISDENTFKYVMPERSVSLLVLSI